MSYLYYEMPQQQKPEIKSAVKKVIVEKSTCPVIMAGPNKYSAALFEQMARFQATCYEEGLTPKIQNHLKIRIHFTNGEEFGMDLFLYEDDTHFSLKEAVLSKILYTSETVDDHDEAMQWQQFYDLVEEMGF